MRDVTHRPPSHTTPVPTIKNPRKPGATLFKFKVSDALLAPPSLMSTEMYSLLIDAYVKDVEEKAYLFKAIQNIPCIAKKADWAFKWIERCALTHPTRNPQPVCFQSLNSSHAAATRD